MNTINHLLETVLDYDYTTDKSYFGKDDLYLKGLVFSMIDLFKGAYFEITGNSRTTVETFLELYNIVSRELNFELEYEVIVKILVMEIFYEHSIIPVTVSTQELSKLKYSYLYARRCIGEYFDSR